MKTYKGRIVSILQPTSVLLHCGCAEPRSILNTRVLFRSLETVLFRSLETLFFDLRVSFSRFRVSSSSVLSLQSRSSLCFIRCLFARIVFELVTVQCAS